MPQSQQETPETTTEAASAYEAPEVEDLETADGPATTAAGLSAG